MPKDQRQEVVFLNFEAKNLMGYTLSFIKEIHDNGIMRLKPHPLNKDMNQSNNASAQGRFSNFYNDN